MCDYMRIEKIVSFDKLVGHIKMDARYSMLRFHDVRCYRSRQFGKSLAKRSDINITVYEIHSDNREILQLFGVSCVPTAFLLDGGIPISRMQGLCESENFLDFVAGVVDMGRDPTS